MKIIRTNKQVVTDIPHEGLIKIKDALTFPNPAYASAKRYSRSRYITIPPYLEYYKQSMFNDVNGKRKLRLEIPIGFNVSSLLPEEPIEVIDKRVSKEVKYPPFVLELRPDQEKAKQAYLNNINNEEFPKCLIQLPTGKGKTILALNLAYTLKQKTLILVHKDDLVTGWQKDIDLCFDREVTPGLLKAKKRIVGEQITIATVQTLSRMSEEELSEYTSRFGLVIQDECHHIGLNIFNVIDKFASKYKLGLSATPKRQDGLDFVFTLFLGGIAYQHEYSTDDEDILPVEVFVKESNAVYEPFLYENQVFNLQDFKPEELPDKVVKLDSLPYEDRPRVPFLVVDDILVNNRKHMIKVCKDIIREYREGHSCIAFFTQKSHVEKYYKYLSLFIPKETILLYYGDNKERTDSLMEKAESRQCLVTLATYAKATEGTNVKSWEVGFLVSSLKNEKNVEQAVGRIRRSAKNKIEVARLYDYRFSDSYSISSHGSVRDRVYRRLKFEVHRDKVKSNEKKGLFSRGFK